MTETKKLVMVFKNSVGKNVSISIDDPKDNITETEIKTTMELIVEKNIFKKNDYAFVSKNYIILGGTQTGGTQTVTNLNNFLFIGDSFTSRIKNTIQSKAKDSYVRAKGGAFPSYWLDNFSQMPDSNNVKGVDLLIRLESKLETLTDSINKLSNNIINLKATKQ